jgi:hypothetical protein
MTRWEQVQIVAMIIGVFFLGWGIHGLIVGC